MRTMSLPEAAEFLGLHPVTLQQRAASEATARSLRGLLGEFEAGPPAQLARR